MFSKERKLVDSKTKQRLALDKQLTRIQYETLELLLNAELCRGKIYCPKSGCFYKKGVIPCTLNDLQKAIGKKVDKMFSKLSSYYNPLVKKVVDIRGREVWMINPDLYWDYIGWELYYNRWLFSTGNHRIASEIVNLSLHYGYYYNCTNCEPIRKIPRSHWVKMAKWWLLIDNDVSISLNDFEAYQPETGITDKLKVIERE